MIGHIRIRFQHQIFQMRIFPCPDQILQIDGSGENTLFIYHIDGHDIVVFSCLLHQLAHSLLDGQVFRDADVVRCHATADLFLIVRQQHLHIFFCILVQHPDDLFFLFRIQIFQQIDGVIGIHLGDHSRSTLHRQFPDILTGFLNVFEDLCDLLRSQQMIQSLPFFLCHPRHHIGNIVFMIIQ